MTVPTPSRVMSDRIASEPKMPRSRPILMPPQPPDHSRNTWRKLEELRPRPPSIGAPAIPLLAIDAGLKTDGNAVLRVAFGSLRMKAEPRWQQAGADIGVFVISSGDRSAGETSQDGPGVSELQSTLLRKPLTFPLNSTFHSPTSIMPNAPAPWDANVSPSAPAHAKTTLRTFMTSPPRDLSG